MEESPSVKTEKKPQKRSFSPKPKTIFIKNPIAMPPKMVSQMGSMPKKIRVSF